MTSGVLTESTIVLHGRAATREEAISEAGHLLVAAGMVEPSYVDAMHAREASVSTLRRTGLSFVRHREPIDWDGRPTEFVIGIAAAGEDHLPLLSRVAEVFSAPEQVQRLRDATSPADVMAVLEAD